MAVKDVLTNIIKNTGQKLIDISSKDLPSKMDPDFQVIYDKCKEMTLTSEERMFALYTATQYITKSNIPGDIVECGVWKGGSTMLAALTLLSLKNTKKSIYMYDTFSGMSKPSDVDIDYEGTHSKKKWRSSQKENYNEWCFSSLEEVKENMLSTGYPVDKLYFIEGKVESTIPKTIPQKISILRLDTDWYESTYHELQYLYPKLSKNGVLIIDDYGHWKGCRKAVDKYLEEKNINLLLNPIDYTARIAIKTEI